MKAGYFMNEKMEMQIVLCWLVVVISVAAQEHAHVGCTHAHEPVVLFSAHDEDEHGHEAETVHEREGHDEHEHDEPDVSDETLHDHDESEKHNSAVHDDHGHEAEGMHEEPGHEGHDHHAENELELSEEQIERFGIVMAHAEKSLVGTDLRLRGTIVSVPDLTAVVPAAVSGLISELNNNPGDVIRAGDVMAVMNSRELAEARAEYLAAAAQCDLAETVFLREQRLHDQQIVSKQEMQTVQQAFLSARIALRLARQKLFALGCTEDGIQDTLNNEDAALSRHEITAPLSGSVLECTVVRGQNAEANTPLFVVADLDRVWAELTVYAKDISSVSPGTGVEIISEDNDVTREGKVLRVTPFLDDETRTASAWVELDNRDGAWMPGMFAAAYVKSGGTSETVSVSRDAVQKLEGRDVVFVRRGDRFAAQPVLVGRKSRERVEILDGLHAGERYVAQGAYALKSSIVTRSLDSHAGHGH